jgi:hypothetical protein
MECYTFGLDRIMMFHCYFFVALVVIPTVMFETSLIVIGPKKYIEMD